MTTRPEALKALTHFRELLEVSPRAIALSDLVSEFISYAKVTYSPVTVGIYQRVLSRFSRLAGNVLLVEVTGQHFDRYKASRLHGSRTLTIGTVLTTSPVTVNVELRALRAAFQTARRWKLLSHHPFEDASLVQVPEKAPTFLTVRQFKLLLSSIREAWLRDVVLFAALTGMRRGEMLSLRGHDVDLSRRMVENSIQSDLQDEIGSKPHHAAQ